MNEIFLFNYIFKWLLFDFFIYWFWIQLSYWIISSHWTFCVDTKSSTNSEILFSFFHFLYQFSCPLSLITQTRIFGGGLVAKWCPALATPLTVACLVPLFLGSLGKNSGVGCCFILQRIFLTQGSNPGLLHSRQILYHLSHQGSPLEYLIQC